MITANTNQQTKDLQELPIGVTAPKVEFQGFQTENGPSPASSRVLHGSQEHRVETNQALDNRTLSINWYTMINLLSNLEFCFKQVQELLQLPYGKQLGDQLAYYSSIFTSIISKIDLEEKGIEEQLAITTKHVVTLQCMLIKLGNFNENQEAQGNLPALQTQNNEDKAKLEKTQKELEKIQKRIEDLKQALNDNATNAKETEKRLKHEIEQLKALLGLHKLQDEDIDAYLTFLDEGEAILQNLHCQTWPARAAARTKAECQSEINTLTTKLEASENLYKQSNKAIESLKNGYQQEANTLNEKVASLKKDNNTNALSNKVRYAFLVALIAFIYMHNPEIALMAGVALLASEILPKIIALAASHAGY